MIEPLSTLPLSEIPLAEACAALDAGYQGYVVPVRFEPAALVRRMLAEHIDLTASHLLMDADGGTAGILLVARRGEASRIAALGIVPERRGAGYGARATALAIAEARARGDRRIVLEVISSNEKAIATYERAGFSRRCVLAGFAHDPAEPRAPVTRRAVADIAPLLAAAWPVDPSWQTAPASHSGAVSPVEAVSNEEGTAVALIDASGETARLLAFAVSPEVRRRHIGRGFMADVLGSCPGKPWAITATLPQDQASGFLAATGWRRTPIQQIEMELLLA